MTMTQGRPPAAPDRRHPRDGAAPECRPRGTGTDVPGGPHRLGRSSSPQRHIDATHRASGDHAVRGPRRRDRVASRHPGSVRRLRILTDRQGGFATAELAAALPAIVLLLLTGLFAVNAVVTQTRCTDAAREAVLAQARGEDGRTAANRHLPPQAQVDIDSTGDTVTAEISVQVRPLGSLLPAMTVTGRATAAREDQEAP